MCRNGTLIEHRGTNQFGVSRDTIDQFLRQKFMYGNGFFDQNVHVAVQSTYCKRVVKKVRSGNEHGSNAGLSKKIFTVSKAPYGRKSLELCQCLRIDIAHGNQFRIGQLADDCRMTGTHAADTDDPYFYFSHISLSFLMD